ncbi:hypothetical protein P7K49_040825 [Saguinus oedipus]|uniref:Uncharacterized protein n=1 Tax=Saguinus oedipus TaxID=9490 RepID=A0ABQ9TD92_SAGOE|nr:hypothetical protein P7K49_040818 [Saguinus oedipus]KAK2082517.1 hypothetical protein P7K49_040825 [Saguinus oedipus]
MRDREHGFPTPELRWGSRKAEVQLTTASRQGPTGHGRAQAHAKWDTPLPPHIGTQDASWSDRSGPGRGGPQTGHADTERKITLGRRRDPGQGRGERGRCTAKPPVQPTTARRTHEVSPPVAFGAPRRHRAASGAAAWPPTTPARLAVELGAPRVTHAAGRPDYSGTNRRFTEPAQIPDRAVEHLVQIKFTRGGPGARRGLVQERLAPWENTITA